MTELPETNPLTVEAQTVESQTTLNSSPTPTTIQLPPPVEQIPSTLRDDLVQGWEFVKFVWRISSRIRRGRDRLRFIIGLILWKPILPK